MTSSIDNDAAERTAALEQITTGIRDLIEKQQTNRSLSQTTLDWLEKLIDDLSHASTFFLSKICHIESGVIVTNLMDGIDDEALQLDYFLYSPFHHAVMDMRATLGVPDLVSTGPALHEGIKAALNVSVEARLIYLRRGAPADSPRPDAGYITKEVVDLAISNPDRESDIIDYMVARNVFSTEIDVEHLTMFIHGERPLSGGIL